MLGLRILSALVGAPLMLLAIWTGGPVLMVLLGIFMLVAIRELTFMMSKTGLKPPVILASVGVLALAAGVYLFGERALGNVFIFVLVAALLYMAAHYPKIGPADAGATILAVMYTGLITYIFLIRNLTDGWIWLVFMLFATWAGDTLAYFGGKKLGRHKLAPNLSPGKTVEGALAGLLGSLMAGSVMALIYTELPWGHFLALALLAGVAGQAGDLTESAFKRLAGVKDSGSLIPGHGGILDRFDSMLFAAPAVYHYLALFIIS